MQHEASDEHALGRLIPVPHRLSPPAMQEMGDAPCRQHPVDQMGAQRLVAAVTFSIGRAFRFLCAEECAAFGSCESEVLRQRPHDMSGEIGQDCALRLDGLHRLLKQALEHRHLRDLATLGCHLVRFDQFAQILVLEL